jgi:class 3 adenylate cyclase
MDKKLIFGKYIKDIKNAINNEGVLKQRNFSNFSGSPINLSATLGQETPLEHIEPLRQLLGLPQPFISSGIHPDFANIGITKSSEEHYIVSVFMDVRKSTVFFRKYNNDQIASVIQTIQSAAIAICSLFNGHIQRLQYDGVFVYFGGKNTSKDTAVRNALNATSFFSYFVKYELNELLKEYEFDKISTRAGIDFGDDDKVSWYRLGIGNATEVTTVSLHTSLAPKMQANAEANGIVVGDNVKLKLQLDSYVSKVTYIENGVLKEDDYIYTNPYYRQHKFDWRLWLSNHFSFVKKDGNEIYIDYEVNQGYLEKIFNEDNQLLRIIGYNNGTTFISDSGTPNLRNIGSPAPNNQFYAEFDK